MTAWSAYDAGVATVFVAAAVAFVALCFIPAPYGRHRRSGWGPGIEPRLAWIVMESPAIWLFALVYFRGERAYQPVPLLLFGLWQLHYVQRTFVFPFRMRSRTSTPLFTAALAFGFNLLNGWLNAFAISAGAIVPPAAGIRDPQLLAGVALFLAGFAANVHADAVLRELRQPGETGYHIPYGGLYRFVTSPNYLGEIVEWAGFALAAWTLPAFGFLLFTAANLVPRAWSHHRWYRATFPGYPPERRAIFPGIF